MDSVVSLSRQATKSLSKVPSATSVTNASKSITSEWPTPSLSKSGSSWDMWSIMKIMVIVIIIAALGFNIFSYLSQGTDYLSNIVQQIASYLPSGLAKTLNNSAVGTKLTADVAAGAIQDVGEIVTDIPKADFSKVKIGRTPANFKKELWNKRDQTLSDAIDSRQIKGVNNYPQHEPDKTSSSSIQNPHAKSWCYVGTDRGYRSCVQVKNSSECQSGKIFPSKNICINPNMRE